MVVVRIELWPHGDQSQARPLGVAVISNDGSGDSSSGNYDVELSHSGKYIGRPGAWRTGKVNGHNRNLSPYHLVVKAITNALGLSRNN